MSPLRSIVIILRRLDSFSQLVVAVHQHIVGNPGLGPFAANQQQPLLDFSMFLPQKARAFHHAPAWGS
jgi:hypothetical protein